MSIPWSAWYWPVANVASATGSVYMLGSWAMTSG